MTIIYSAFLVKVLTSGLSFQSNLCKSISRKCQDVSFVIPTICISSSRYCIGRVSGTVGGTTVSISGLMSSRLDSLLLVLSKLQMLRVEIVF